MQYGYDPQSASGSNSGSPSGDDFRSAARGGGTTLGVALIVIGAVFLAAQVLPGLTWWTLWPVLIVVMGLAMVVTPSRWHGWGVERVADGIGTALFGLLLLANTTGYVSWQVWFTLLSLWPVLLISAGIGLLAKASGQDWLRAVASVPVWIVLLYAAGLWWAGAPLPIQLPAMPSDFLSTPFLQFR
ncbi:MAG: hypothetical protein CVT67_10625 [Actinobacteria bacterium HGW-Actinobacteria-7]|jgi:hypothetical protein|nr:MAG: hypothetical protein CVT67_10625 [Actinobacteria bacterium HGW-Actinobacteria-7]